MPFCYEIVLAMFYLRREKVESLSHLLVVTQERSKMIVKY